MITLIIEQKKSFHVSEEVWNFLNKNNVLKAFGNFFTYLYMSLDVSCKKFIKLLISVKRKNCRLILHTVRVHNKIMYGNYHLVNMCINYLKTVFLIKKKI